MAWLLRDGEVLASLTIASSRRDRRRGLLRRDGFEGALLLEGVRSVHSIGMRFPLDVADLDGDHVVLRIRPLPPNRLTLPMRGSRHVLEAEAGSFERWGLRVGDALVVDP